MNFSNLLTYVTHNSESIIQWLFFSIMGLAAIVVGRQIFFKPAGNDSGASSSAPLPGEIQEMLTRIIEQTGKLQSVSVSQLSTEAVPAEMVHQLELLKKDLQTREEEISRLQRSVSSGGDSKELGTRVKELEAKLEEYSILEDDIADLSLYKEENVRLKSDLEKLRAGGAVASEPIAEALAQDPVFEAAPVEVAPQTSVPPVAQASDDLVAEFAQAVNTTAAPSSGAPIVMPKTSDPMADFESTLRAEKQATGTPMAATSAATPAAPPRDDDSHSADLFAEFSEDEEDGSNLDTDRMMEEMAALVAAEAKDGSSVLEENVDTDKMLEEAKNFTKTS